MPGQPQFFLSPELMDRAFAVIFERLADEATRDSDHADYYESQRGCFERAQAMHAAGLYPMPLADHHWLMPSETGPAIVHLVERVPFSGTTRHGWRCGPSCRQRGRFHKHTAYLRAIEVAMELAEEDDASEPPPPPDAAGLVRRLTAARAARMAV